VLNVLDVRSGSARAALQLEDTDVQRWMMSAIEENSGEAFSHIEAEIEEKLEGFIEACAFTEAVEPRLVRDGLSRAVEEALEGSFTMRSSMQSAMPRTSSARAFALSCNRPGGDRPSWSPPTLER
jgi:hypothetical protein